MKILATICEQVLENYGMHEGLHLTQEASPG